MSKKMATGDFFHFKVNYEEKMYAAGKYPGGFNKRRSSFDRCDFDSSLRIDRPIVRCLRTVSRNEVQVINTVLSYDADASAPMAAMFGSSLALSISDIPLTVQLLACRSAMSMENWSSIQVKNKRSFFTGINCCRNQRSN